MYISCDSGTSDATMAPVFSDAITDGDAYEMWKVFTVEEINEAINQAIMEATDVCLNIKETHNTFTQEEGWYCGWFE